MCDLGHALHYSNSFECLLHAGEADIGCLASPANATVQYVQPQVVNLHFHANSEHTRLGAWWMRLITPLVQAPVSWC